MQRTIAFVACLLLPACGARIEGDAPTATDAALATDAASGDSSPSVSPTAKPTSDASPPSDGGGSPSTDVSPPLPGGDVVSACGGTISASKPDALVDWFFSHEHEGCGGASTCGVFLELKGGCTLWTQDAGMEKTVTMTPPDCASLRTWLASDVLQNAMKDPSLCGTITESGNPDSNEFVLGSGDVRRKTPRSCTEPPLDHHHACIQAVLDAYRPGAHL